MSRQLLILRHAKSDWNTEAPTDFERPLAKRGNKDAPRIGQWLKQHGLKPDYVVSSPAQRAKQTAVKACRELGIDKNHIHWDTRIYDADIGALLEVLAACPRTAKRVLIVGHNPGLEILLNYLCGEDIPIQEDGKLLPTATVAHLNMAPAWNQLGEGTANLIAITRPRSLP